MNYNQTATEDDGSCEYCECGYEPNPNFNPNRPINECNSKCVKIKTDEEPEEGCTNCDLIDKLSKTNANVNINVSLPNGGNGPAKETKSSSQENKSAPAIKKPKIKKPAAPTKGKKLVKMN